MHARRDPFARVSYMPHPTKPEGCTECGAFPIPRHPNYTIIVQSDGGRSAPLSGVFCSWQCAETYHGHRIGR